MTLYLGILGGGNISQTHLRAALEINGVNIAAVCGQNAGKTAVLAQAAGVPAYHDLDAFFSHRPMDAVLIGSPSGLHAEQGIAAAGRGLHVLVEKPIDINTERADALITACEQAHVKLGVFFQDRAAVDILKLKRVIDEGVLGKPILISASVRWYRPTEYYRESRWRGKLALDGGGALMNQGIHTVDLLLYLFGEVSCVWGRAITALHEIEVEDTVVSSLVFASGAIGNLEAATSAYPGFPRRIEMTWSQGTVVVENDRIHSVKLLTPIDDLCNERSTPDDERATSPVVPDTRGHRALIEDFVQAIVSDGVPLCDGHQARRSVELVRAIYESSRTGQAVTVSDRNALGRRLGPVATTFEESLW
ncbi:MAG TPA: Gfo/Idh/MocA family oxidoreductase [Blastocatellia bacterium]|nr:Gfo/Idh/MocA family oxidoreductase [Blastocatellia bacterium]